MVNKLCSKEMIVINFGQVIRRLMEPVPGPCVSIYLPLKQGNESIQGQIMLKNLLREAESQLQNVLRRPEVENLLEPAEAFLQEARNWERQAKGLAVFMGSDFFQYIHSPREFASQVVVSEGFHLKPILPLLNNPGDYYVLDLDLGGTRLFYGTEFSMQQVELADTPLSLDEAMKYDDPERQLQFHTGTGHAGATGKAAQFHGQGVGIDDEKSNILRFYNQLNYALRREIGSTRTPLVLGGVEYLTAIFREASDYQYIQTDIVAGSLSTKPLSEIREKAWLIVAPHYRSRQDQVERKYRELLGTGLASQSIEEIVLACYQGRVDSLFVATDVEVWSEVDPANGVVNILEEPDPANEELLNLAAIAAIQHGGKVYALKQQDMPDHRAIAAVYRF